jgi:hypothetical protein
MLAIRVSFISRETVMFCVPEHCVCICIPLKVLHGYMLDFKVCIVLR